MTKHTSKAIAFAAIIGLVAGLTGGCKFSMCHSAPGGVGVCPANLKDGLPTILCQPMDADFTNTQKEVSFEVAASGDALTYQWSFNGRPLAADGAEGRKQIVGAGTAKLTIRNPTIADSGFYRCTIAGVDSVGFPAFTATRDAVLGLGGGKNLLMAIITTPPTQPVPVPGGSGSTGPCGAKCCSSVPFKNNGLGYQVTNGNNYFTLTLTNETTGASAIALTNQYTLAICDMSVPKPTAICASAGTTNKWRFTGISGHAYLFNVYFTCPAPNPAIWPHVYFSTGTMSNTGNGSSSTSQ